MINYGFNIPFFVKKSGAVQVMSEYINICCSATYASLCLLFNWSITLPMKLRYLFMVFFLSVIPRLSVSQVWDEYIQAFGNGMSDGVGVSIALSGSIFYASNFKNTFVFQSDVLSGNAQQRGTIGKLFPDKSVSWALQIRSTQPLFLRDLALNGPAVAVAGEFSDSLFIGNDTIVTTHQKGMFISFFDTTGNYYYTLSPDVNSASVNAIYFDDKGFVYATGDFFLHFNFDTYALSSPNGMSFYMFKFDVYNQQLEWLVHSEGTGTYGQGIDKDLSGNVYAAGSYGNDTAFDGMLLPDANGAHNAFLVSYSASGELNWIRTMTGNGQIHGVDVKANSKGDVFLTGDFEFMIDSLDAAVLNAQGHANAFVCNYSAEGEMRWIERIGGNDQDKPTSLALDSAGAPVVLLNAGLSVTIGNVEIPSYGFVEPLIVKLNPQNGTLVWSKRITAVAVSGIVRGADLYIHEDQLIVTGANVSGLDFNGVSFNAPNFSEFFISMWTDTLYAVLSNDTTANVSVNQLWAEDFRVYPNPSVSSFTVSAPSEQGWSLSVFDLSGKLVLNEDFHALNYEFGMNLHSGFYVLRIAHGEMYVDQKICKL